MHLYNSNENFKLNNKPIENTIGDFWTWAYSDLTNNINRSVLAEYIVASALNLTNIDSEKYRIMFRAYDLLTEDNYRVEVKSAANIQSWGAKHPNKINFKIAPARLPDETGDYKDDAPKQRNCDIYVFCVYRAQSLEQSPLDLDLWDFYVLATSILDKYIPNQLTISLPSLMKFKPIECNYSQLKTAVSACLNNSI